MNLELSISIDGETMQPNQELSATLNSIIQSYIKQKISGVKEKKIKVPKANKPRKPHPTQEQIQALLDRAKDLQDKNKSQAAKILMAEFGGKLNTIYGYLLKAEKTGQLKFAIYEPSYPPRA